MGDGMQLRDPLYGMITLDPTARALIDTAAYQRLRRIKQLGMVQMVYPSAVHSRFEHAVGAYHLAGTMLQHLAGQGDLRAISDGEITLIRLTVLLHDLAHHPGAHLLEEFRYPGICHEAAAERWFTTGEVGEILERTGIPDAGRRIGALVRGEGESVLRGIVSGPCDADKLDYLARDAYHCGLPAGFDLHYLRSSLALVIDPRTGARELGISERALTAFEQMVYAKNVLYRSVYFHPTVRSVMAMLRATLVAALEGSLLAFEELLSWTDEELFTLLRLRIDPAARPAAPAPASAAYVGRMIERMLARRLFKTAAALPLGEAPDLTPAAVAVAEQELARALGLERGEALLDIPRKPSMLGTEILVRCETGEVIPASELRPQSGFALNVAKESLYESSGRVRVFTASPVTLTPDTLRSVLKAATP